MIGFINRVLRMLVMGIRPVNVNLRRLKSDIAGSFPWNQQVVGCRNNSTWFAAATEASVAPGFLAVRVSCAYARLRRLI